MDFVFECSILEFVNVSRSKVKFPMAVSLWQTLRQTHIAIENP